QMLQIRHGDCDPITVLHFPEPLEGLDCALIGAVRFGFASSPIVGAFQRTGVSPDGRHVVFEVTDHFSVTRQQLVPPEQPGIFIVRADGRGLRRLGPASRDPPFRYAMDPVSPIGVRVDAWAAFSFSSDGRTVVLTDLGPGPAVEEAVQIFTLDLVTGKGDVIATPAA